MRDARLDALGAWFGRYRVPVAGLDRRTRRLVVGGVGLAVLAVAAMLVLSLDAVAITDQPCVAGHQPWPTLAALGVAVTATALGVAAVAAAGAAARTWPLPRLRFVAVVAIPLLLALAELVSMAVQRTGWASVPSSHLRAVWPFLTLVGLLTVLVATHGRGPRRPIPAGLTVLLGFGGFVGHTLVNAGLQGGCLAVIVAADNLALVGFFAIIALPALLIWLGVEGLRLSGDLGQWAMQRVAPPRLLWGLLAGKLTLIAALALWSLIGRPPAWLAALTPTGTALVFAVPVVVAVLVLLSREHRWIRPGSDAFAAVGRGFTLLITVILLAVPAYGLAGLLSALIDRSALGLALLVATALAVVAGLLLRRPTRPIVAVVLALGLVGSYAVLLWAYARSGSFRMADAIVADMDLHRVAVLLGVPAVVAVVAAGIALSRPRFHGLRLFFVALLLWVLVTTALPLLLESRPGTNAIAVDLVLTVAIVVVAVLHRLGCRTEVSTFELVLLLITTTVIVEGPVLIAALPSSATFPLLVLAFLAPAVAALGPDAQALIGAPQHRERLLTRVGLTVLGYGLLGVIAALAADPLGYLRDLPGLVNGTAALPFAVVLVAARSARERQPAPTA